MKKTVLKIAVFTLALAAIPTISLLKKSPALSIPTASLPSSSIAATPEPPTSNKPDPVLSTYLLPEYYLIKDHKTDEQLTLSPLDYIKGVVAGEMPLSFEPEALKAQAVAAHTYALRQMGTQIKTPDPDLNGAFLSTDPAHFQAYFSAEERQEQWGDDFPAKEEKLTAAVSEVLHNFIMYGGEPIAAAFHSFSVGKTETAANVWGQDVPYLLAVDTLAPEETEATHFFTAQEVSVVLSANVENCTLTEDPADWLQVERYSESGAVLLAKAGGCAVSGRELREWFGLPSANFTVSYKEEGITFTVKGSGHGVGMSQRGANEMAKAGKMWQDILLHYYTGVQIVSVAEEETSLQSEQK